MARLQETPLLPTALASPTHVTKPEFTAADDQHHFAVLGDDWWATETARFSFHVPERGRGGWFYTILRPNIGTVARGCWVWDAGAALHWEVPYSANYSAGK